MTVKESRGNMLSQKIQKTVDDLAEIIADVKKFARTDSERKYLIRPVEKTRLRLAQSFVKIEFLEGARAKGLSTSQLAVPSIKRKKV